MENAIDVTKEPEIEQKKLTDYDYYIFLLQNFLYGTVVGLNSMLIPIFALQLDATPFMVGLISGSRGIGHFAFVVPIGFLLDRFGSKKIFLYASYIDFFIILTMAFANTPLQLLTLASLEGIACSTRLTAVNGAFLRHLNVIDSSKSGWYKGSTNSGLVLTAPLIGGLLLTSFGMKAAIIATSAIVVITNIVVIFLGADYGKEGNPKDDKSKEHMDFEDFIILLKNPRVIFTICSEGLGTGYISSFRTLMALVVVGILKYDAAVISRIVLVLGVAYIFVVFIGSLILKNIKTKVLFMISALIMIPNLVLLSVGNSLTTFYIGAFFSGIGMGILSLGSYRMMSEIKSTSGKVAGLFTFGAGFSLALAPMLSSFIAGQLNAGASFMAFGIPFALIGTVCVYKNNVSKKIKDNQS